MKTLLFRLLLFFALLSATTAKALPVGNSCANAIAFSTPCLDNESNSASFVWYSFTASVSDVQIQLVNVFGYDSSYTFMELYSGSCSSLTLLDTSVQENYNGVVIRTSGLTVSNTYYVKISKANSNTADYSLCVVDVTTQSCSGGDCNNGCNLVCNPSFELNTGDPTGYSQINLANCWLQPNPGGSSTDYITPNATTTDVRAPHNYQGTELAHYGGSYAGIICYSSLATSYHEAEYLTGKFTTPLVPGTYAVSFWVSLADSSGFAVRHLGAYISTGVPSQSANFAALSIFPQVYWATAITQKNGWAQISGTFTASGGENYITIGYFQFGSGGNVANIGAPDPSNSTKNEAYYFVDDVSVTPLNVLHATATPNPNCDGTALLTVTGGNATTTYTWAALNATSVCMNAHCDSATASMPLDDSTLFHVSAPYPGVSGCIVYGQVMVHVHHEPNSVIGGFATNNCKNGYLAYTTPGEEGIVYAWTVVNGTSNLSTSGDTINVQWNLTQDTLKLTATDTVTGCSSTTIMVIPPCCTATSSENITFDNTTASQVLASPSFSSYVTGTTFSTTYRIIINGVFTIDTNFTFLNCPDINFGGNAVVNVLPGDTFTFDSCKTDTKCDYMWDGVYSNGPTAMANVIHGSIIKQARNVIVSVAGGKYLVENSELRDDYKGIVVKKYNSTHGGIIRGSTVSMVGSFITAIPPLPSGHYRTLYGVEIDRNANITIGDTTSSAYTNTFKDIYHGVYSNVSNVKVYNGQFRNLRTNFVIPESGTGIRSIGGKAFYGPALTVGGIGTYLPCTFDSVLDAISTLNPLNVSVTNNTMQDVRRMGVFVKTCSTRNITIEGNTVNNSSFSQPFYAAVNVVDVKGATVNIRNNNVYQSTTSSATKIGSGIRVFNVTPSLVTLNVGGNMPVYDTRTGIWLVNVLGKNNATVIGNDIEFTKPNSDYTTVHYGIRLENCAGIRVDTNTVNKSGSAPVQAMQQNLRGISVENSPGTIATNNELKQMGSGVYGWSVSSNSTFACNTMDACYNSVVLGAPVAAGGAADIGDQVFDPFGTPAATGNTYSSNVAANKLVGKVITGTNWMDVTAPSSSVIGLNVTTNSYNPCGLFYLVASDTVERDEQAGAVIRSLNTDTLTWQQAYLMRKNVHRLLREHPSWLSLGTADDTLYQDFYAAYDPTNFGLIRNIEEAIDTNDAPAVLSECFTLVDTNQIETAIKTTHEIYGVSWMDSVFTFSSTDSATLYTIATEDPVEYGNGVYTARVLLDYDADYFGDPAYLRLGPHAAVSISNGFKMYPNPTKDEITIEVDAAIVVPARVEVFDVNGKVVLSHAIVESARSLRVSELQPGIYFVRVVSADQTAPMQKLVIIK